ncbi:MAG TPA: class II aldolase/adducin family protein, partial [Propionibacteriaceae bacterium]|nr:class II aldolase/adducin family protein [Propionibacteriaceae bacterium]
MTAAHNLTDLVDLSRTLGEPWRRFAILAEGNTSQRIAEDQLAVKATGRSLRHASAADFVVVSLRRLSDIVDDSQAGDADVARYFDEVETEQGMRPSVEALLHVVCVLDAGATTVAHTHPESVNSLLCSDHADVLAGPPIFPDQVVVFGRRGLLVPY